jgi:hypothetical protein
VFLKPSKTGERSEHKPYSERSDRIARLHIDKSMPAPEGENPLSDTPGTMPENTLSGNWKLMPQS